MFQAIPDPAQDSCHSVAEGHKHLVKGTDSKVRHSVARSNCTLHVVWGQQAGDSKFFVY